MLLAFFSLKVAICQIKEGKGKSSENLTYLMAVGDTKPPLALKYLNGGKENANS
jgi:hypothetical protein